MNERETADKKWSRLVAQAWADDSLKQRLLDRPASVLEEYGIEVPAGLEVKVVENTDRVAYLTLPAKPSVNVSELSDDELAGVAGGFCCRICACRRPEIVLEIGPVDVRPAPKTILT